MNAATLAVELAKTVFQLAVADASWKVIQTHGLTRDQFERWFASSYYITFAISGRPGPRWHRRGASPGFDQDSDLRGGMRPLLINRFERGSPLPDPGR